MQRNDFLYQAFYCEENIWQLCQLDVFRGSYAVVIASQGDTFPMFCQRAAPDPATPLLWDYHVVLLTEAPHRIVDFDTTLPFCSPVENYFQQSFADESQLYAQYIPYFRLIPARTFAEKFCSDRSHMKTANGWQAEPPPWPQIGSGASNLQQLLDPSMTGIGEVLSCGAMLERFGSAGSTRR